jgi:hypothetical protein
MICRTRSLRATHSTATLARLERNKEEMHKAQENKEEKKDAGKGE